MPFMVFLSAFSSAFEPVHGIFLLALQAAHLPQVHLAIGILLSATAVAAFTF
jgi:hypothetical protein